MGKLHGSLARAGKVSFHRAFEMLIHVYRSESKPPRLLRRKDWRRFLREEQRRDWSTIEDTSTLILAAEREAPTGTLVDPKSLKESKGISCLGSIFLLKNNNVKWLRVH